MVFPSTLIISTDSNLIDSCINQILNELGHRKILNNPDIFTVADYSIAQIKSLRDFLSLSPYQHDCKIVILPNASLLLTEAQNALLKMLEEPGERNYFILTVGNPGALLPTIISRCHQVQLVSQQTIGDTPYEFPTDLKTALLESESLSADKNSALNWLQHQLNCYHQQLIKQPSAATSATINKLIKAISMINSNVDAKSAFDYLFLT